MPTIYGYCRVSTKTQNIDRQIDNIRNAYPTAKIYAEKFTGTKLYERKEFTKVLKKLEKGDTLVFDSVSRMSRNASEGFTLYKELHDKNINLIFLKEHHIDTDAYEQAKKSIITQKPSDSGDKATNELVSAIMEAINKFMFAKIEQDIYKAFEQSEKEVLDLRERTKEGLREAKRKGKHIGVSKGQKFITQKSITAKDIIKKHSISFGGSLSDEELQTQAKISRNTLYKYKREIRAELQAEQDNAE